MNGTSPLPTNATGNEAASATRIRLFAGVLVVAVGGGGLYAWSLRYLNDDAFISFRYAKNLVNGLGLVYNAGEKVEGYTNILWTLLMATGMKLGIDPENAAILLGIFFYALTLSLFGYLSWKFARAGNGIAFILPVTTAALCFNRDFAVYATSGLETSMNAFFVSAGFAALLLSGRSRNRTLLAGTMLTFAMFARPDSALFLAAACVYCLLTKKDRWKSTMLVVLPALVLYIPYWLWRWNYYGYFYPNTFYAKSIDLPYWSQGILYAQMFFETYYVFALLPIFAAILFWRWKFSRGTSGRTSASTWSYLRENVDQPFPLLLVFLFAGFDLLFVVRAGGDFMFARFFIAIVPPMYFGIEYIGSRLDGRLPGVALCIIVAAGTFFRNDQFTLGYMVDGIADECQLYTMDNLAAQRHKGETLRKYLHDLPATLVFIGSQARIAYYSDVPTAIEATTGLTDSYIAHQPLEKRGRPGHEKPATAEYLWQRGANFIVGNFKNTVDAISFDDVTARIIMYNNALMSALQREPGVRFAPCPEYLDWYISRLSSLPPKKVEEDYQFFQQYYFSHNRDSVRQAAFASFLANPAR